MTKNPNRIYQEEPVLQNIDEVAKIEFREEIENLMIVQANLNALMNKYEVVLEEINKNTKKVEEFTKRLFPAIYFSTAKHHTTKEPYIIARSMWKKGLNDYVQISAYVGPLANFKYGIEDDAVKKIALEKIRKKIKEKFPL